VLVLAAGAASAVPRPVRAAPTAEQVALGLGISGDVAGLAGIVPFVVVTKLDVRPEIAAWAFYGLGGAALGLGGAAVGVQARAGCADAGPCRAGYATGGVAMSAGLWWIGFGAFCSALGSMIRSNARVAPVPLAIRTEHGVVPGVGVAGFAF
jgi:hypothetical protein